MRDDLPEILITHYVGGAWVAPLGTRNAGFFDPAAGAGGTLVFAAPADITRAVDAARRAAEGLAGLADAERRVVLGRAAAALAAEVPGPVEADDAVAVPDGRGRTCAVIVRREVPAATVAAAVLRLLAADLALVMMPDPRAPLPAVRLAMALHGAGLPPGCLNLIHGDAAAARALAAHPGIGRVWPAGQLSGGIRPRPRR